MRRQLWSCVILVCLAACSRSPSSERGAPGAKTVEPGGSAELDYDPATLVTLDLVASVDRIGPGAELEIGALFTISPGWYIYWQNPGESGLETRASFRAPDGITLGEVLYPGPLRFESPGDITSYGYRSNAVLFTRATAPESLPPGEELAFHVEARWLACREVCIQGSGTASVRLPVAEGEPEPANEDVLGRQRQRLPRPWAELDGATHAWSEVDGQRALTLRVPGASSLEFFPAVEQPAIVAGHEAAAAEGHGTITVRFRGAARAEIPARGVVRIDTPDGERFYEVAVPWS